MPKLKAKKNNSLQSELFLLLQFLLIFIWKIIFKKMPNLLTCENTQYTNTSYGSSTRFPVFISTLPHIKYLVVNGKCENWWQDDLHFFVGNLRFFCLAVDSKYPLIMRYCLKIVITGEFRHNYCDNFDKFWCLKHITNWFLVEYQIALENIDIDTPQR